MAWMKQGGIYLGEELPAYEVSSQDARIRRSRKFRWLWKIGFLLHQCLKPRVVGQFRGRPMHILGRTGSERGPEVLKILLLIRVGFFEKLQRLGSPVLVQTFNGFLRSGSRPPRIHGRAAAFLDRKLRIQETALTIPRISGGELCRNVLEPCIISKLRRRLRFPQIGGIVALDDIQSAARYKCAMLSLGSERIASFKSAIPSSFFPIK